MGNPSPDDRWSPMRLTDVRGRAAYAWFPPGTRTDPEHLLPRDVYAAVCRLAGVSDRSPWVAFPSPEDALEVLAVARGSVGVDTVPYLALPPR